MQQDQHYNLLYLQFSTYPNLQFYRYFSFNRQILNLAGFVNMQQLWFWYLTPYYFYTLLVAVLKFNLFKIISVSTFLTM